MQIHSVFTAKMTRATLRCNFVLIFPWTSHLKHLILIVFLEDCLPEVLAKVGVLVERSMKKKKHRAIAPAALGVCGGLGQLWVALAELWEALGIHNKSIRMSFCSYYYFFCKTADLVMKYRFSLPDSRFGKEISIFLTRCLVW